MDATESTRQLSVDDFLDMQFVSDAQIDPAGRRVAFVVADAYVEKGERSPRSRIWLAHDGAAPVPITHGPGSDDLPRWSPDGESLAFRSDRAKRGTGQLYLLRGPGEAAPLHTFDAGVTAFQWAPDGRRLAVLAPDPRPGAADREEGDDRTLFEEEHRFDRIWLLDPDAGAARCLTTGPVHVWELAWSPDGRAIAALVSDLPYLWSWYQARLVRVDVSTGEVSTLYTPERQLTRPVWSPDGRSIAVISSTWSDPGMTGGDVFLVPSDGGESRNLTMGQPRSHLAIHWLLDGSGLITGAFERGRAAVCEVGLDGETETRWRDEWAFASYDLTASADRRTLAAVISRPTAPAELWIGHADDRDPAGIIWEQRSALNARYAFPSRALLPLETLTWKAPDGTPIEGLLIRPTGQGPAPMVTLIHGGPTGLWTYGLRGGGFGGLAQMLAARGSAVLMPNPRGSAGWGLGFAEANHGDMGGDDLGDILAGVDSCVQSGIADPDRLGVGGWSYGGYLTAWAITQTDRFKAALAGASITNWYSFHGGTNIPAFDEVFYRADPYALDGPYATRSPIFYVGRARTPTLFLHGEQDPCCPVGQAYEMARGLRARGVETQCVVYPREGHGIRERLHQRDLLERAVAWFVSHLGR